MDDSGFKEIDHSDGDLDYVLSDGDNIITTSFDSDSEIDEDEELGPEHKADTLFNERLKKCEENTWNSNLLQVRLENWLGI